MNFQDTVLFLLTMFVVYYLTVSHESVGSRGQESLTLIILFTNVLEFAVSCAR